MGSHSVFLCLRSLLLDVLVCAVIVPLIGTYLSGACAKTLQLSSKWELVLIMILTFTLVYGAFYSLGEVTYWQHLFAFEEDYVNVLKIRDGVNFIIGIVSIVGITSTVEMMVCDKSMKPTPVGEGAEYFVVKTFLGWLQIDQAILPHLGLGPPHPGSIMDPEFGENGRYEHGGAYMFYWAVLSSCTAKLLYLNTLFTYLRAMETFLAMNPQFG